MAVDFEREKRWWDEKAPKEERDGADQPVNRALRWREIDRRLDGVTTILDVGAATGAFSIPLAKRGFEVTHFDLSTEAIAIAQSKATGLSNIRFVKGNAIDLSQFRDGEFDLVLNLDGAVSFCGEYADLSLSESARVAGSTLIVTVLNRARMTAVWVGNCFGVNGGQLVRTVDAMFEHGHWNQDQYPENAMLAGGCTQGYLGTIRAYTRDELAERIQGLGLRVIRCTGLGSLVGLIEPDRVQEICASDKFEEFIRYSERFDLEMLPDGPGTRQRAGLIAVAER